MEITRSFIKAQVKQLMSLQKSKEILEKAIRRELNLSSDNAVNFSSENLMHALEKAGVLDGMPDGEEVELPTLKIAAEGEIIELNCPVDGGTLVAAVTTVDPEAKISSLYYYAPNGTACDIATAEVKTGGLAQDCGLSDDNKDIDLYIWGDPLNEDYTDKVQISHDDIIQASER